MTNIYRKHKHLDIKNNILNKVSFLVTGGPLAGQVVHYYNMRYDKQTDTLYFEYQFETPVEINDDFDFIDYLGTLLRCHLAYKEQGSIT